MDIEIDSDLDDVYEVTVDSVVVPYAFEPLRQNGEDDDSRSSSNSSTEDESDEDFTNGRPVEEWCSCNNCVDMPTLVECRCCKTTNVVDGKADGLGCIIDHDGFAVNCTNIHVLETSFYEFIDTNGRLGENEQIHEVYRYVAYRRFTRWIYGLLGRRNRRVIPSCVVKEIRRAFPSELYSGFKYPTG